MADVGPMRIDRPMDLFSQNSSSPIASGKTKKRTVEDDTSQKTRGTKRKRDDEQDSFATSEPPAKRAKPQSGELLPHVKKTEGLPEKGSDVKFDRSFLHEKKEEWTAATPQKEGQHSRIKLSDHRRDQILLNFEERLNATNPELTGFEQKLLASDLGHLVKVATQVIDMRMDEQKETLESFKLLSEKMRHLRGEKSKVLDDMVDNAKLQDTWSAVRDMVSFLTTGLGIATGVGTFACGFYTGNYALMRSGIISILGSIGNMSTKWMAEKNYGEKYTNAVTLISTLLVGYTSLNTLPIPQGMGKMGMVKSVMQVSGVATQSVTQYKLTKASAEQYTIEAESSKIQFHHEKNKSKLTKALGRLKLTELMNEVKAASKQIGEEDKLKERIAQILSSAA